MAGFSSQKFDLSSLGYLGEQAAQGEYRKRGLRIVVANLFNSRGRRMGEIDFIALGNQTIYFVEVKTRTKLIDRFGGACQAVGALKQRRLLKLAKLFLLQHPQFRHLRPQIDVCVVIPINLDKRQFSVTILANVVTDDSS
jgi:Holliday junction resolvase-like predicted endonuclease